MRYSLLLLVVTCLWPVFAQKHPQGDKDNTDGCDKEFLFFEFTTAAPVTQVIHSFKNVIVLYSFKVFGAGRYFFVVKNDQSQALNNLTLPDDACLTVSTFPVETFGTFFRRFGIDFPNPPFDELLDPNLVYFETVFQAKGFNEDQYKALLALQAALLSPATPDDGRVSFVSVARLQTKYIFFSKRTDCEVATGIARTADSQGGPGNTATRLLRLHRI